MSRWIHAVKAWNERQRSVNPKHCWCMPRKGTPEHAEVSKLMAGHKAAAGESKKPEAKKEKGEIDALIDEMDELLGKSKSSKEEPKGGASGGEKKMPRAVLEEYLAGFEKRKAEHEASKEKREAEEKKRAAAHKEKEHKRGMKEVEKAAKRRKAAAAKKAAKHEMVEAIKEETKSHRDKIVEMLIEGLKK